MVINFHFYTTFFLARGVVHCARICTQLLNESPLLHGRWSTPRAAVDHRARIDTERLNESQETARAVVHCCTGGGPPKKLKKPVPRTCDLPRLELVTSLLFLKKVFRPSFYVCCLSWSV